MNLPADIVEQVDSVFGESAGEARRRLDSLASELDPVLPRVIRCVVHLAKGDLERLEYNVRRARTDWRDVVYRAEYDESYRRIRDWGAPFSAHQPSA